MKLEKIEGTGVYKFHVTGKISESDANLMSQSFKEFKARGEKIKLLGIIDEAPIPDDWDSIKSLANLKMNSFQVISKYAVLSGKKWIGNWVPVGDFFTPGIDVKAFNPSAMDEAISWLNTEDDTSTDSEDYLSNVPITQLSDNSYEVNINEDRINLGAMSAIYDIISKADKDKKVNFLMTLETFPSFDSFKAFIEGLKIDLKAIGRIGKFAVVSDANWIETYAKIGDFITPGLEMKAFSEPELEEARTWVIQNN